ncbi:MAG: hypothetical protein WDZ59_03525 [Pirellulales bacterium]
MTRAAQIHAVQPKDTTQVTEVTIALGNDPVGLVLGSWSRQSFAGTLSINGSPVKAGSTIEQVNRGLEDQPLRLDSEQNLKKGAYVAGYGNVVVMLEPADGVFNAEDIRFQALRLKVVD